MIYLSSVDVVCRRLMCHMVCSYHPSHLIWPHFKWPHFTSADWQSVHCQVVQFIVSATNQTRHTLWPTLFGLVAVTVNWVASQTLTAAQYKWNEVRWDKMIDINAQSVMQPAVCEWNYKQCVCVYTVLLAFTLGLTGTEYCSCGHLHRGCCDSIFTYLHSKARIPLV